MVLLVEGITATGVSGARFVAGGSVRAGTGAAGDTALEVEGTVAERAGIELGGSRLGIERPAVVAGSTVATTPSTIVIVV